MGDKVAANIMVEGLKLKFAVLPHLTGSASRGSNQCGSGGSDLALHSGLVREGHCKGSSLSLPPFLFQDVLRSEKERQGPSYNRSFYTEQDACHSQVQDGDSGKDCGGFSRGALGDFSGFGGCLLSPPYRTGVSEVLRLLSRDKDLRFSKDALRPVSSALGFHTGFETSESSSSPGGDTNLLFPGRFSDSGKNI